MPTRPAPHITWRVAKNGVSPPITEVNGVCLAIR